MRFGKVMLCIWSTTALAAPIEITAPPPAPSIGRVVVGMFIGLAALTILIGLWISLRALRDRHLIEPDESEQPAPTILKSKTPTPRSHPVQCPECERIFANVHRFCPYHGRPLEPHRPQPGERAEPAPPRRCPQCNAHFPTHATYCPKDGCRLIDVDAQAPKARICPSCGGHYPADTQFCGLDGARLVLLN